MKEVKETTEVVTKMKNQPDAAAEREKATDGVHEWRDGRVVPRCRL